MSKGGGAGRHADLEAESAAADIPRARLAAVADAVGAKKVKKKCCRSTPERCKSCPVVLMRTERLAEAGLSGKALKKAMKKARAA